MKKAKAIAKYTIIMVLSALILFGCSKNKVNNETAEKLDGNWNIVQITKATGVVDPSSMPQSVTLTACKVSKEDCIGEWVSNKGDKNNFFWTISEEGEIFSIIVDPSQPSNQATSDLADYKGDYEIVELTETVFKVKKEAVTIEFGK